jgi:hypothetical protein
MNCLFREVGPGLYAATESLSYEAAQTWMLILSLFGHGYRWNTLPPAQTEYDLETLTLPPHMDRLWTQVAAQIGQLRVAAFWNTNLCNWTLKNPSPGSEYSPDELTSENVQLLYNWLPRPFDRDAEAFMRTFILVEARGTHLLAEIVGCIKALARSTSRTSLIGCCGT